MRVYDELAKLQKLFFDSYLTKEDLVKQYKKIHQQQLSFLKAAKHSHDPTIQTIYSLICSLHLLRFRCNDLYVFEICAEEMKALQTTSIKFLQTPTPQAADDFLSAIHAFETIFSNTLNIVARDPFIFEFFIQDLYALHGVTYDKG